MNKNDISFRGKTAIVTGSTRGIGRAIADSIADLGGYVVYTGTRESKNLANERRHFLTLDLLNNSSIEDFLKEIKKLPKIDILVNNAGINIIESIGEINIDHWNKVMKINLTGAMRIMKDVAKKMIARRQGGKILNVSSIFGVVSKAKRNAYSASKAGLIGLTKTSALDLAPYDILVNALCPGFTMTDMTTSILTKKEMESLSGEIPLGRFANESEIAAAAVFLCSDLNSYMTGQTFVIDGGFTAQ